MKSPFSEPTLGSDPAGSPGVCATATPRLSPKRPGRWLDPKGRIRRVAGRNYDSSSEFSGDGGPATKAELGFDVSDITATADGGFLIADTSNCRIRRVTQSGIINTVAGSGPVGCDTLGSEDAPGPAPADGGPATAARLRSPVGVAALPDGGFVVSEGNRVRRVGRDGTITSVAGTGQEAQAAPADGVPATSVALSGPRRLAPATGGGFLVRDAYGIHRVRPDGIIAAVAGTDAILSDTGAMYASAINPTRLFGPLPGRAKLIAARRGGYYDGGWRYFDGWGDPATRALPLTGFGDVEPAPRRRAACHWRHRARALIWRRPSPVQRAARNPQAPIAIARETLAALIHRRLRFRLTRAARVRVRIYTGRRVVARRVVSGRRGLNSVRLPRRVKPGLHHARVRANSSDGAVATNGLRVLVGPGLTKRAAREEIDTGYACAFDDVHCDAETKRCRRFGARRVDCVVAEAGVETGESLPCATVVSAVLRRSGYLYLRPYGCHKRRRIGYFRARPRYTGPAEQATPP